MSLALCLLVLTFLERLTILLPKQLTTSASKSAQS